SYQVAPSSLGLDGRSVRCANCHSIWFATPVEAVLEGRADVSSALPDSASGTADHMVTDEFTSSAPVEPHDRLLLDDDITVVDGDGGISADFAALPDESGSA